ncbi:MAG: indolepyruvate oxidoreductase subunit beta [Candidatus Aminicenantales bacterium]
MPGRKKQDIILAGVGGQGILSIAFVIDHAAIKEGLNIKQAEVHGMAQRGGAVQSHLRISSGPVFSDLVPRGEADMILSVEPLEALRYLDYLHPEGMVITSSAAFANIPDYPPLETVLERIRQVKRRIIVDSEKLAREAGSSKSQNMVMLGAASKYLIVSEESLREFIRVLFASRGDQLVETNFRAFQLGRDAADEK